MFLGDVLPLKLYFTDGAGTYSEWSGEVSLEVKVAIGDLKTGALHVLCESFTYDNNCYSGNITFATNELSNALSGVASDVFTFEVQITRADGSTITIYQNSVEIRNQLLHPLAGTIYQGGIYDSTSYNVSNSQPLATFSANKIRLWFTDFASVNDFAEGEKIRFTEIGTGTAERYFNITSVASVANSNNIIDMVINSRFESLPMLLL